MAHGKYICESTLQPMIDQIWKGSQKKYFVNLKEMWRQRLCEVCWAGLSEHNSTAPYRNTQEALPLCSHSSAKVVISRMRRMMLFNIIFFIKLINFLFVFFKATLFWSCWCWKGRGTGFNYFYAFLLLSPHGVLLWTRFWMGLNYICWGP